MTCHCATDTAGKSTNRQVARAEQQVYGACYISGVACVNTGPVATGQGSLAPPQRDRLSTCRSQKEAAPGGAQTPTEGLTTRSTNLLMAIENPTGGDRAVPIALPTAHVTILRGTFASCLEGVRLDLTTPDRMPNPDKARREADAYERLLAGLERGEVVVPDQAAREAVEVIATAADRENNYAEVVAEHDALHGLLARLTAPPEFEVGGGS
jgi:hypothetical protein